MKIYYGGKERSRKIHRINAVQIDNIRPFLGEWSIGRLSIECMGLGDCVKRRWDHLKV